MPHRTAYRQQAKARGIAAEFTPAARFLYGGEKGWVAESLEKGVARGAHLVEDARVAFLHQQLNPAAGVDLAQKLRPQLRAEVRVAERSLLLGRHSPRDLLALPEGVGHNHERCAAGLDLAEGGDDVVDVLLRPGGVMLGQE